MPRPTEDQLSAWCIRSASSEAGSCRAASNTLYYQFWSPLELPKDKRTIRVYIDRGWAQDHWAFAAIWAGDNEETVIDNTIGQFNGEKMVFIGTIDQWLAKLSELLRTDKVKLDPEGELYDAAFERERKQRGAAYILEQERNAATASEEAHIAETLQKSKAKKSNTSGRCVIL
jgi:hypothetical protein